MVRAGWESAENGAGETIPAFACVKVSGYSKTTGVSVFTIDEYDGSGSAIGATGNFDIASTATGLITLASLFPVLYDDDPSSLTVGESTVGPVSGQYEMGTAGEGFVFMGSIVSETSPTREVILVQRLGGGGGSCDCSDYFQVRIEGIPTSGTFDLEVQATNSDDETATEDITIQWDSTVAEAKTQLATHTKLSAADITADHGELPSVDLTFGIDSARSVSILSVTTSLSGSGTLDAKVGKIIPGSCNG